MKILKQNFITQKYHLTFTNVRIATGALSGVAYRSYQSAL